MAKFDEHEQTRLTIATLVAALVKSLAKNNPELIDDFTNELNYAKATHGNFPDDNFSVIQAIRVAIIMVNDPADDDTRI